MSVCGRLCWLVLVPLAVYVFSGVNCWQRNHIYSPQAFSYPRDWDPPPLSPLRPRMEVISGPQATVVRPGGRVRSLSPGYNHTVRAASTPRGRITSTVSDGPKVSRRGRRRHLAKEPARKLSGGGGGKSSLYPRRGRNKVCARCPSDRAVLAKKGSTSVLMETPPIVPCYPWSSVKKVKQKVVAGPQPGDEVPEGSHKIVLRLYRHRRTLATCVTRYNVIVRKCGEPEVGPGVRTDCPLGKAWGGHCSLSCDPGYQLESDGKDVIRCTDDLEWSGPTPICVPTTSCPMPLTPEHGHLSCRTPHHLPVQPKGVLPDGSQCHYLCDPGYTIPPAQHHLADIRCVAGSWDSPQDPTCVETNELEDEEELDEAAEDALSFRSGDCPEGLCLHGGLCVVILGEPLCSCRAGYYGVHCEHGHPSLDTDTDTDTETHTDLNNTLT